VPVEPSRTAARSAQLLKLLATEPERHWSLAEVARRLGVHRSSCQTLLLALSEEGLVRRRDRDATYRLGPSLIALGHAALASVDAIELADALVDRLRLDLDCSGLVGTVAGDSIVIAAAHAEPDALGYSVTAGTRRPLRAPVGPVYVAWSSPADVESWFDRAVPPLVEQSRAAQRRDLATIRDRGWSATVRVVGPAPDREAVTREASDDDLRRRRLTIIGVSAPTWIAGGELACVLALAGFHTDATGAALRGIGEKVQAAAAEVTASLTGRPPPSPLSD
jgi:DNA-binding IclR family transcriptional regulator